MNRFLTYSSEWWSVHFYMQLALVGENVEQTNQRVPCERIYDNSHQRAKLKHGVATKRRIAEEAAERRYQWSGDVVNKRTKGACGICTEKPQDKTNCYQALYDTEHEIYESRHAYDGVLSIAGGVVIVALKVVVVAIAFIVAIHPGKFIPLLARKHLRALGKGVVIEIGLPSSSIFCHYICPQTNKASWPY